MKSNEYETPFAKLHVYMNELPKRKHPRLEQYDYSSDGAYFITVCVKDKREMLGKITVGRDYHGTPYLKTRRCDIFPHNQTQMSVAFCKARGVYMNEPA